MADVPPGALKADRFEIRRRLGSGGFGEVYEAFDRERHDLVALKILRRTDAGSLYRFKQEFRALADLAHRNLVTLHELIAADGEWLLTMELIRGVNFIEYVRAQHGSTDGHEAIDFGRDSAAAVATISAGRLQAARLTDPGDHHDTAARAPAPLATLRLDRVRSGLQELVAGVMTLHRNGILHLDIKPSNVLVTTDGRVVLVDFGLAEQLRPRGSHPDQSLQIIGTPEFMSPEQAVAEPTSEASDWYCVGALLYRALTGLAAFPGDSTRMLSLKIQTEPVPPGELVPEIPPDLDALCRDLMRRDPARRPSGGDLLARLGAMPEAAPLSPLTEGPRHPVRFVGRASHLAALTAAFDDMRQSRAAAVHIIGRSGMGKTALVRQFVDGLEASAQAGIMVLEGRCYEHAAVPFKAFDALLDDLSTRLCRLPDVEVAMLLPRGIEVLARVFPSLRRVPAIAAAQERTRIADPTELRRRAFTALREFLARVAERYPLVVVIDDLQWGDVDSAALLDELLRPPQPPPLLLIVCYRSDERETSACLRTLLAAEASRNEASTARHLDVAELTPGEAEELALALVPGVAAPAHAQRIAHETQGNPFFIEQLARHAVGASAEPQSLETMLAGRLSRLPETTRRFMEVVAVAGRPVEVSLAAAAAGVESGKYDVFAVLRAARLLRSRTRAAGTQAEPYHDRIREIVVSQLAPAVRQDHHHRLALVLEESNTADPETLAMHFRAGGDREKAARYAIAAAQRSAEALAFAGAARLYTLAIELHPGGADVAALHVKRADALAMIGNVIDAADAYLAAADQSGPIERVELRRRAGEQYLQGFHLDRGLELLRTSLAATGMRLPRTAVTALVALLLRRLYLRWRGTEFRERPESDIAQIELQRLDLIHALSRGLGFTDSLRALELQSRHLALALAVGEPFRVARALALSATADGLTPRGRPQAERRLAQARAIGERLQMPFVAGIVHSSTGLLRLSAGRWLEARDEFDRAEATLREKCVAPPHTTMLGHVYRLESLLGAGALAEYFLRIPEYTAECQGRGDLHAEVQLRIRQSHLKAFAHDDVEGAAQELATAEAMCGNRTLHVARVYLLFRRVELALYSGAIDTAWQIVTTDWRLPRLMRLFGFQNITTSAFERRAYCALAMAGVAAAQQGPAQAYLRRAERDARHIEAWQASWGVPVAQLIRGVAAIHRGDLQRGRTHLEAADRGFTGANMQLHRVVARWRLGSLIGGAAGADLVRDAEGWMREQGVRNPQRLNGVIAPWIR